jgi:hypothetical protein
VSEDLVHMGTRGSVFLNEYYIFKFKKLDFFLHVGNYLFHKYAKNMPKYFVFWAT